MEPPPRPSIDQRRRSSRIAAIQATSAHQATTEETPLDPDGPALLTRTEFLTSEGSAATQSSANTKHATIRLYGDEYWHCGKTNLRSANDQKNGIRLFVLCHQTLDKIELAAWVFIPSDLEFFIAAEKSDYERRINVYNISGIFPVRPGTEEHIDSCGGMYDAYMLRHYMGLGNWQPGRSTFLPNTKHWHGDPMITLQKGFLALGLCSLLLPKELEVLSELYQLNDTGPPQDRPRRLEARKPTKTVEISTAHVLLHHQTPVRVLQGGTSVRREELIQEAGATRPVVEIVPAKSQSRTRG
ncbi:MAG: hypothetical protein Q9184_001335 [Pyrenodesmia sp. 2 TL-2023]